MKNSAIIKVVVLGLMSIIGITAVQSYWVVNTWNINEEEFNSKVNLALRRVANTIVAMNSAKLPTRNLIHKRTSNYFVVNTESEIDAGQLEYFLQKEFETLDLRLDFEYAVFDCQTNEMMYGSYCQYNPSASKDIRLGDLPKHEGLTYYFGVKFPTRSGYLFNKVQLLFLLSLILLLTVVFFAYSLYVIVRQQGLSVMQKNFINTITHEFKTPISSIKLSSDALLTSPELRNHAKWGQYTKIIQDQNERLNKLVEKVLQIAKIETGKESLKKTKVNLMDIVDQVLQSVKMSVEQKGGEFLVEMENKEAWILADPVHLANILYNLLDNAVKYSKEVPEVRLKVTQQKDYWELSVSDKGIGIPKQYQKSVFEKFFRIPTGNLHEVKGFGLGLYYVRKICKAHGWKIELRSEPGEGTTITLKISG